MEPRGCNRSQWVANAHPETPRNQAETAAVSCDRLPETFHGKEGVDGSSPSEGSAKFLLINSFCCPGWRRFWASTSTERPPRAAIASASGLEPLLLSGFAGFPGGVHPASTARSIASASSSETACWRLHPASDRKSMPVAMLR